MSVWFWISLAQFVCIIGLLARRSRKGDGTVPDSSGEAESQFVKLYEKAADFIYIVSATDGRVLDANRSMRRETGYSLEELSKLTVFDLHPETVRPMIERQLRQQDDENASFPPPIETQLHCRENRKMPVSVTVLHAEHGGKPARVIVARDITVREQAAEGLKETNRLRGEMIQNISHELRTPLTAIIGWTDLLLEGVDGKQQTIGLNQIKSASEKLLQLVNDFLDLAKIERGAMQLDMTPSDISAPVRTACQSIIAAAHNKRHSIQIDIDNNLPPVLIDAARIQQVVWNLLSNAIKFTPDGGSIVVEATREGEQVLVSVTDSGIGIESKTIPLIFQGFRQANGSATRQFGGTGVGLVLVKSLLELHGGSISVDSTPGKGSRFTFSLPIANAGVSVPSIEALEISSPSNPVFPQSSASKTVLVIDDDENLLKLLGAVVRAAGYDTVLASGGTVGIEKAKDVSPSVILLDIGMPDLDGFATFNALRGDPNLSKCKIIALTAYAGTAEKERITNHGFDGFIAKPFKRDQLIQTISRLSKAGEEANVA